MPKLNAVLMVVLAVAVIAGTAVLTLRTAPAASPEPARYEKLIRKLADPDPDLSREAAVELRAAGPAALPALREAAKSPDTLLAGRAARLAEELQPTPPARVAPSTPLRSAPSTE